MTRLRFRYTCKGADLRSVGAWYMVCLARDGKLDEYIEHGGCAEEYGRLRDALGAIA